METEKDYLYQVAIRDWVENRLGTEIMVPVYGPKDENEKYLYGIFDFGGGTTDFDFGVWRGASDEEYDKYNCDFILECFGADSDVHLGGENILEM